jgi:adenosylhomocysteine nucleosidase
LQCLSKIPFPSGDKKFGVHMKLAVITAMEKEVRPLFQRLGQAVGDEIVAGVHTRIFVFRDVYIYLVLCGIGEILAAGATQLVIDRYKVDYIVNFGYAGSLTDKLKTGDLVLIDKVVHYQYDLSALDNVKEGQYNGRSQVFFDLTQSTRDNMNQLLETPLPVVTLASGDKFIADSQTKNYLRDTYGASVCDMELAGITITALRNGVHVASVKLISDDADEDAPKDFNNAINRGISAAETVFMRIVNYLYA